MQQHPVPQQISTYEFKLVGDMTLKQFLQLAAGIGIAFLFFVSPIPDFIKWPMIAFFSIMGAALAFLPIEERSLFDWIRAFIKAVYSPTHYVFKQGSIGVIFEEGKLATPQIITPQGQEKAEEYLSSIPQPEVVKKFEEKEKSFFQNIIKAFQSAAAGFQKRQQQAGQPTTPQPQPPQNGHIPQPTTANERQYVAAEEEIRKEDTTPVGSYRVPDIGMVRVEPQMVPQAPQVQQIPHVQYQPQRISPVLRPVGRPSKQISQSIFAPQAAPPNPPEYPNIVVGQVLDNEGGIIEGAILEIREIGGLPVRAIRTNKVGHFLTVTPLKENTYEIITEKDGFIFDPIQFKTEGKIIPPILIKAKGTT